MLYLFASCVALLIGPVCYRWLTSGSALQKGLDGFVFVSLGGLVLIHILPELLEHGGLLALLFVLLGLWGPTASERLFHRYSEITHNLTLLLGIGGLLLHTVTDGGAMVLAQQDGNSSLLALGVILHRMPVGLAIWWLLKPHAGALMAGVVLALMMLMTSIGYFAGEQLLQHLSLDNTVYLQAFVTGSILHVVLHQPHGDDSSSSDHYQLHAGIGSLLGLGLLTALLLMDAGEQGHEHHHGSLQLCDWLLTLAPALLLAHGVAAVRFALGVRPQQGNAYWQWLQRLAGPEVLLLTLLLLGPWYALLQLLALVAIGGYLAGQNAKLPALHLHGQPDALRFGFCHGVDRSAPWILFSLLLANLIGHPAFPLDHVATQLLLLLLIIVPLQFSPMGSTVLAATLAYSGWEPVAIAMALCAPPLLQLQQFSLLKPLERGMTLLLLALILGLAAYCRLGWQQLLPDGHMLGLTALFILALLYTSSLIRQGPRRFLQALKPRAFKVTAPQHHAHGEHHH